MSLLEKRRALITGGAQGLGLGFAELLLQHGGRVCLLDVREDTGKATEAELNQKYGEGRAVFVKCNVTSQEEVEAAFEKAKEAFGGLDLVVNNAGVGTVGGNFARTIDINLTAVIRCSYLAEKYMSTENGGTGGQLINMASAGGLGIVAMDPPYMCSKHGVVALSRSLAMTYAAKGITVKCLCPTFVNTTFFTAQAGPLDTPEKKQYAAQRQEYGILEPSDVVAAFKTIVEAEDMNGSVMLVSPEGNKYVYTGKEEKGLAGLKALFHSL